MDIFSAIPAELALLKEALLLGAGMFALYDCIRVVRRIFPHGILWVSLEDFLYWVAVAGWFFLRICKVNSGIIRFYVLFAVSVGALIYYALLSRLLMKYISIFILRIKMGLKKVREKLIMKMVKFKRHEDEV